MHSNPFGSSIFIALNHKFRVLGYCGHCYPKLSSNSHRVRYKFTKTTIGMACADIAEATFRKRPIGNPTSMVKMASYAYLGPYG